MSLRVAAVGALLVSLGLACAPPDSSPSALCEDSDCTPSGKGDGAILSARLWPNGDISIVVDDSDLDYFDRLLGSDWWGEFQEAIDTLHTLTPVRVRVYEDEANAPRPYVHLRAGAPGDGIAGRAHLGTGGTRQFVLEASSSALAVRHELGHIVGLYHTHQRPDRDDHIRVHDRWIESGANNFRPASTGDMMGPYDTRSVMHYGSFSFSKRQNGEPCATITPRSVQVSGDDCVSRSELGEQTIHRQRARYTAWNVAVIAALYCEPRFCGSQCAPPERCERTPVQRSLQRFHTWELSDEALSLRRRYGNWSIEARECHIDVAGFEDKVQQGTIPDREPAGCFFDLQAARLIGADLRGVDLRGTEAFHAYFDQSDLSESNFRYAMLERASFQDATLVDADFTGAVLHHATLRGADLSAANLEGADLRHAKLERANLDGAHIDRAIRCNTWGLDLSQVQGEFRCPD